MKPKASPKTVGPYRGHKMTMIASLGCISLSYLVLTMTMESSYLPPGISDSSSQNSGDPSVVEHFNKYYSLAELKPLYETWTMVSEPHQELAIHAVEHINLKGIEGDIVECGVWKGGMSMGMIFANMRDNTDRHFWLFDTFEGLPPPTEKDEDRAHNVWEQIQKGDPSVNDGGKHRVEDGKWNFGALPVVKNNVYYTNYPRDKVHFVKGKVEDTLPVTQLPEKIALLRLDTDFYESTKIELEMMWDRLVPGGVLIVDDFWHWNGARLAVTEFFAERLGLDAVAISKKNFPCMFYQKPGLENA
jgi:O-methyltransferase